MVIEPAATGDAPPRGPAVVRFVVRELAAEPAALLLFEGLLGDYHVGRIRDASLPSTLVARLVPAVAFHDDGGAALVVSPEGPLIPGVTYSLAALGHGLLSIYQVEDSAESLLTRVWPPRDAPAGTAAVYCGPAHGLEVPRGVQLSPGDVPAQAAPGADRRGTASARCLRLDLSLPQTVGFALPPPEIQGVPLDPAPLVVSASVPVDEPLECEVNESPLGALCMRVGDDHVVVRAGREPKLLAVQTPAGDLVEAVLAGKSVVLGGFEPGAAVTLLGTLVDLAGDEESLDVTLVTHEPVPHLVLSEVLANPAGAEPDQEWIELVNDAALDASLAGFTLEDASGSCALPPAVLAPRAHALLVSEGFDASSSVDVAPAAGTLLLRVPRLGGNGLSNSGEALALRDGAGQVVSRFPKVAMGGAGASVVRGRLRTADDALAEFAVSDSPTPGWSVPRPEPD